MRRQKNIQQRIYKGKKYPAHQIARKKKFLPTKNHPSPLPPPSRVKWSAPYKATVHCVAPNDSPLTVY